MKPSKLKKHLQSKHPTYVDKSVDYFERLKQSSNTDKQSVQKNLSTDTPYGNDNDFIETNIVNRQQLRLPVYYTSRKYVEYLLNTWQESDVENLYEIFAEVIEEGQTCLQETTSIEEFRRYFLSKYCFVIRKINNDGTNDLCVGGFHLKSNFPGRSSHIASYGLLVHKKYRRQGLANFMVKQCIRLAKQLNFKALYTDLVYVTNITNKNM